MSPTHTCRARRASVQLRRRDLDVSTVAGRRLFEYALQTWDIEVTHNPLASMSSMAVTQLVDRLIANLELASGRIFAEVPTPIEPD